MEIKSLGEIFTEDGNFKVGMKINPYSLDSHDTEVYKYLFSEDGYMIRQTEAVVFIKEHNCSPFSDIVEYYYSHLLDLNCKGNYTAIFAWRH